MPPPMPPPAAPEIVPEATAPASLPRLDPAPSTPAARSPFDGAFESALHAFRGQGMLRHVAARPAARLDVSSNDYLGLSRHPGLAARAADWARACGSGAGASRLVSGTLPMHLALERKLAALKGTEAALLFASGWQANASVLSSLLRFAKPAQLFADTLIHASLHHGARAAGVTPRFFRHNDLAHLESLLAETPPGPGWRVIVTESVFSMDGDQADVPALAALARRHRAFLYLDEAHATGVLGPRGMGLSGLAPGGVDLAMGTFSKALGGFGAYVAGSQALCDWLVNRASGFIHTTALPPAVLGAMDAALDLAPALEAERARLHGCAARLREGLARLGVPTGGSTTQIVPAIFGSEAETMRVAASLRQAGILAIGIRPPTVPPGTSRVRFALSAAHSAEDIDFLLTTLAGILAARPADADCGSGAA